VRFANPKMYEALRLLSWVSLPFHFE
jgi:hypothetical protein